MYPTAEKQKCPHAYSTRQVDLHFYNPIWSSFSHMGSKTTSELLLSLTLNVSIIL